MVVSGVVVMEIVHLVQRFVIGSFDAGIISVLPLVIEVLVLLVQ